MLFRLPHHWHVFEPIETTPLTLTWPISVHFNHHYANTQQATGSMVWKQTLARILRCQGPWQKHGRQVSYLRWFCGWKRTRYDLPSQWTFQVIRQHWHLQTRKHASRNMLWSASQMLYSITRCTMFWLQKLWNGFSNADSACERRSTLTSNPCKVVFPVHHTVKDVSHLIWWKHLLAVLQSCVAKILKEPSD